MKFWNAFIGLGLLLPQFLLAQTTVHGFTHGGLARSYRVHVPPTYTGASAVPLVLNLHGYTSNAQQQELYSGMNAVSDTANFIVCYPDGMNNSWNSGFSLPYYGGVDDVGFLSVLIDSLSASYNIDPTRVYSCGMSNGGFMSYRLACDLENRIAAIASVTGSMTSIQVLNCNSSRAVPIFEIHGDQDQTVPYNGGGGFLSIDSVLSFWRGIDACTAPVVHDTLPDAVNEGSTVTTQFYGGCTSNTEVLHYKIRNGGHTWPGSFSVPGLGITNQDINASVEIWHFFSRFVHPAPALTGIAPAQSPRFDISPNPFRDQVSIRFAQPVSRVGISDLQGRWVYHGATSSGSLSLDTRDWPCGLYMMMVEANGGVAYARLLKVE